MKVAVHGATGRMGLVVSRLAHEAPDMQIVGAVCASVDPHQGKDIGELAGVGTLGVIASTDLGAGLLGADVVIDFSHASAVPELVAEAARQKLPVVSGTTGLDPAGMRALEKASGAVAVLWAPNMSVGIQVLAELVEHAVRQLGDQYDVEITEVHHRKKKDAPSGTARRLFEAAQSVRSHLAPTHSRQGDIGERRAEEVGVFALRGGDVVGEHTVHLFGPGEWLELTHRATSRELFGHGALRAARFVVGRKPGLYSIKDVLTR
ncbi:MAG TPA: 4-hydroxy-tetrahydrodipicolinate reductase [Polyangiaceae bacterium]